MDVLDKSDVHLCLRCNRHINGLENYVRHRQEICQNVPETLNVSVLETQPEVSSEIVQQSVSESNSLHLASQTLESTGLLQSSSSAQLQLKNVEISEISKITTIFEGYVEADNSVSEKLLHDAKQNSSENIDTADSCIEIKEDSKESFLASKNNEIEDKPLHSIQKIILEEVSHTGETIKDLTYGSYIVNNKIVSKESNTTADASDCSSFVDYDYSRYLEDVLLGNINVPYKKLRAYKANTVPKKRESVKATVDEDFIFKGSSDKLPEIRNQNYRKRKCKDIPKECKEKSSESDINTDSESDTKGKQQVEKQTKREENKKGFKQKSNSKRWQCPVCNKVMRAYTGQAHMRIHSGEKPYKCHLCTYASKTQSDMRIHMKRHLGIKEFKCSECDYATPKRSMLTKHLHRHQREKGLEESQYQCDECGKKYSTNDGLKLHIKAVHSNIKPFTCTFENCKYAGVSNSELEIHIRTHTKEKPFLCTECGYKAGNKNRLRRHMITHSDATPFKCDYPGCSFVGKTAFRVKRHKKQHDPVNQLCCPYCPSYTTFYLGNLRKHIKKKHKDTKVYLCELCKTFNTDVYKDLIEHYEEVHKGDIEVTIHSGGLKLGQFNHLRQQEDQETEEPIAIIPGEAIEIADNVEFAQTVIFREDEVAQLS